MLDVHPPHAPTHTWRDFLLHIATIVVGLLIAVGLEQTVEFFHHRHQVAETRHALEIERKVNQARFASDVAEVNRFVPVLKTDLAVFLYLRQHPGAPRSQWPGTLSYTFRGGPYNDGAWTTALQSNILPLLPQNEVRKDAELYKRLESVGSNIRLLRVTQAAMESYLLETPDETKLTPSQIDAAIVRLLQLIQNEQLLDTELSNTHRRFPDFGPEPSQPHWTSFVDPQTRLMNQEADDLGKAMAVADPDNTTGNH